MAQTNDSGPSAGRVILSAEDLRKSYGARVALKSLSFSLSAGRVLGFLGPNGAGKTTSIRILTTVLAPTSGRFVVDGIGSDQPEVIRRRIGVLPEGLGFPAQMTGLQYLTYFGQLFGRRSMDARATAQQLLEDVGLQHRARSAVGSYSHGMRQRLGIARALVNDPAVVFLDEPTLGLDPRGQQELLKLIHGIARERDKGVVLCSHLLSEIEGICDDVVIMNAGEVVARGTVGDVIGQANPDHRNQFRVRVPQSSVAEVEGLLRVLPDVKQVLPTDGESGWLGVELIPEGSDELERHARHAALQVLIDADVPIVGFDAGGGRLEDVFLRLTAEAIR